MRSNRPMTVGLVQPALCSADQDGHTLKPAYTLGGGSQEVDTEIDE